jgi:hypothetical protein
MVESQKKLFGVEHLAGAEGVFTDLASFVFLLLAKFISCCTPVTNMLYLAYGMEN